MLYHVNVMHKITENVIKYGVWHSVCNGLCNNPKYNQYCLNTNIYRLIKSLVNNKCIGIYRFRITNIEKVYCNGSSTNNRSNLPLLSRNNIRLSLFLFTKNAKLYINRKILWNPSLDASEPLYTFGRGTGFLLETIAKCPKELIVYNDGVDLGCLYYRGFGIYLNNLLDLNFSYSLVCTRDRKIATLARMFAEHRQHYNLFYGYVVYHIKRFYIKKRHEMPIYNSFNYMNQLKIWIMDQFGTNCSDIFKRKLTEIIHNILELKPLNVLVVHEAILSGPIDQSMIKETIFTNLVKSTKKIKISHINGYDDLSCVITSISPSRDEVILNLNAQLLDLASGTICGLYAKVNGNDYKVFDNLNPGDFTSVKLYRDDTTILDGVAYIKASRNGDLIYSLKQKRFVPMIKLN